MRVTATPVRGSRAVQPLPCGLSQGSDEQYWNTFAETDNELPSQQSDPSRSCVY